MDKIKKSTLALVDQISFIVLQRKSFLTPRAMKSSNGQRLACRIHHTNCLGGILSVIRYMLQKSIVYGKLIWHLFKMWQRKMMA